MHGFNLDREKVDLYMADEGLTVAALARRYGCSRVRMTQILDGRKVTPVVAGKVATALGCRAIDIIKKTALQGRNQQDGKQR